jgi:endonuclease V
MRESYPVISGLNNLKQEFDVLLINGHGLMHPRGFGLASQVSVLQDVPTIGVAKRLIDERYINVATQKHHTSDEFQLINENNHTIGGLF